ncbi:exonuclease DPD1, chloroplastic/mitochondrial isoform X2 [Carica papaya]|uniref:exonuclease DPD1, chloroplastic/mitochondrial isoform X2 n=1 Tax=Carica papaya TaxID=3649 RepID=UPI000B8C9AB1|nr:exonuclease DPD1, chloroplastic/mitochondrial isoform X2 [Carica papaya]
MRTLTMCFSILQVPKCRIHLLANSCWDRFYSWRRTYGSDRTFRLLSSKTCGFEGGHSKRWSRRHVSTKPEGTNKNAQRSKPNSISHEILGGTGSTGTAVNVNIKEIREINEIQYCDIQQKIAGNKDVTDLVTIIVFDIETTGLSREKERIIEVALQDLSGGDNSTFQTLVNPECYVPNSHVHGISTHMVCRPDVPRMVDLIPILLKFVQSRQKPEGYILWVAHNGLRFDFPFLFNEFERCSHGIPQNWLFIDTIPLARELMKSNGSTISSGLSLQALREHFKLPLIGSAHRAMSDVRLLSLIFQRLSFGLKLPISGIVERSVTASDITTKKKKNSK